MAQGLNAHLASCPGRSGFGSKNSNKKSLRLPAVYAIKFPCDLKSVDKASAGVPGEGQVVRVTGVVLSVKQAHVVLSIPDGALQPR